MNDSIFVDINNIYKKIYYEILFMRLAWIRNKIVLLEIFEPEKI